MLKLRKAAERFHTKNHWLDSRHSFSFGEHHDVGHMGFGPLRVINEDRVRPGAGFPTHGHRDMEIITLVLEGALEHKDSTGGGSVIRPCDVQKMSAGSGISHSEFNTSATEEAHLLQIWIVPDARGVTPGYVQRRFAPEDRRDRFCLAAAKGGRDGAIPLHQDAMLWLADLSPGKSLRYDAAPERLLWLQLAGGAITANGQPMQAGDGLAIRNEAALRLTAQAQSTLLLFDMTAGG